MRVLKWTTAFSVAAFVFNLSGCQSARYVLKENDRGVVAIPASTLAWPINYREQAGELMQQHFPEGYVVEKEEEIVVGEVTHFRENSNGRVTSPDADTAAHTDSTSGWSETKDKRELRLSYRRATPVELPTTQHASRE